MKGRNESLNMRALQKAFRKKFSPENTVQMRSFLKRWNFADSMTPPGLPSGRKRRQMPPETVRKQIQTIYNRAFSRLGRKPCCGIYIKYRNESAAE